MGTRVQRGPQGGWASGVSGSSSTRARRRLSGLGPIITMIVALAVGAWFLWPRTEGDPSSRNALPTMSSDEMAATSTPPSSDTRAREVGIPRGARAAITALQGAVGAGGTLQLVVPSAVPRGWVFEGAEVVPAARTDEHCDQVGVYWTDPTRQQGGVLDVYQYPKQCAKPRPKGSQPFEAQGAKGWVLPDTSGLWRAQLTVAGTTLEVHSDLAPPDLAKLLGARAPFDADRLPPATFVPSA
ncbi:MAG: hypothetical protein ACOYNI_10820 [Acidimicrobiia bacterium]